MAKKTEFELQVEGIFAESATARRLREQPPAVEETNRELRQEWEKVGVPLIDRLKEIGRSARFKKAQQLYRDGLEALLRLGFQASRIEKIINVAEAAVLLHERALNQLDRIGAAILKGMDPHFERPHMIGCKSSDSARFELRAISHADQEINSRLGTLEELFAGLLTSQRRTVTMPSNVAGGSRPGNPTEAQTDPSAA